MTEDLSKKTIWELIGLLTVGQVWTVLVVIATLIIGSFTVGSWTKSVQLSSLSVAAKQQAWVIIKSVELFEYGLEAKDRVQVYVSVNGEPPYIAFPIDREAWIHPMMKLPEEVKFPLPRYSESYRLGFTASLASSFPTSYGFASSEFDVKIIQSNLPMFKESVYLFSVDDKSKPLLKVNFSVIKE